MRCRGRVKEGDKERGKGGEYRERERGMCQFVGVLSMFSQTAVNIF